MSLLTPAEVAAAGSWLAAVQLPTGALPWETGRHTDPWDHVEAAMGLDVAGRHREAERAYDFLADVQNADGGWFSAYHPDGSVDDASAQSGYNGYIAVGVWHHLLATGDEAFARRLWPVVVRALEWVLDMQAADGTVGWARSESGSIDARSLVTGSSSLVQALRTGARLADHLADARPDWELAADRLGHALAVHPGSFWDRSQWAMDWYYPVLAGVLHGSAGAERISTRWDRFVREGRGTRCVSHEPWFTVAETCELAVALDLVGRREEGIAMITGGRRLSVDSGVWWTGWVDDGSATGEIWPAEQTTWTAGAMLLAVDVLTGTSATSSLWRDVALTPVTRCDDACPPPGDVTLLEIDRPGAVSEAAASEAGADAR